MEETKKKPNFIKTFILFVIFAILFGALFSLAIYQYPRIRDKYLSNKENNEPTPTQAGENLLPTGTLEKTPISVGDVSSIVENAMPAIVSVECVTRNIVYDFWGSKREEEGKSAGSGIIISQKNSALYLVTNEHVIKDAKSVNVIFADGTSASADVKGFDSNADIAVLKVNLQKISEDTKKKIRIATLGDSSTLKAGDFAIAIGNALGYGQSLTVGYISATEREITVDDVKRTLLQTDAAINPGNSGGALLNANGEVIGINSAKYAAENVERLGYAIPISDAIPIISALMNREVVSSREAGSLGISGQTVTSTYSQRFGIPVGVYVNNVKAGSCAEKAGIKAGDVIVGYNGMSISTKEDLDTALSYSKAGTKIKLTISYLDNNEYVEKEVEVELDTK